MKTIKYIACVAAATLFVACQPKMDVERVPAQIAAPAENSITGQYEGEDYVWTWTPSADTSVTMQVATYINGSKANSVTVDKGVVTYRYERLDTNVPYTFVFKFTNGKAISTGTIKNVFRPGAAKVENLTMEQVEATEGYNLVIKWNKNETATKLHFSAIEARGERSYIEDLKGDVTEYTITNVVKGESWTCTIVAENAEGPSLTTQAQLPIGNTKIAFLSEWSTPEDHVANADDDEAAAWLWFHKEYPNGIFLPFATITDGSLDDFRVLFWIRDLETGNHLDAFAYSQAIESATPYIENWYMEGGSLLLWQHATTYIEKLGRIPEGTWLSNDNTIGTGVGGHNPDTWRMAVQLAPAGGKFLKDQSSHPIYRGLESKIVVEGNQKLLPVKGPGWTEDHNCLFFNYPAALTGKGNQEVGCYDDLVNIYGIRPLGMWDSQIEWVSQLNVWEAGPCVMSIYLGTALCVGNGGLEFAMKNADGSPDLTMSVNSCQENVLAIAKNCIEYLKTR